MCWRFDKTARYYGQDISVAIVEMAPRLTRSVITVVKGDVLHRGATNPDTGRETTSSLSGKAELSNGPNGRESHVSSRKGRCESLWQGV